MPEAPLRDLLPSVASWLEKRHQVLSATDRPGRGRFLPVWDKLADLAYGVQDSAMETEGGSDLASEALSRPGGVLAGALLNALSALKLERGSGLGADLKPRFDRVASAPGRPGLLARVYLVRALAFLDAIDTAWAEEHIWPRLSRDHREALALWRSYAYGRIGSARLFNALKPATLAAFQRKELSNKEFEGLVVRLLDVGLSHQHGESPEYELTPAEIRRALAVGPSAARQHAAWNLWRTMGAVNGEPNDKATRWRNVVGPLFRDIWPLDARLRSENTSRNLVLMALECDQAFPRLSRRSST